MYREITNQALIFYKRICLSYTFYYGYNDIIQKFRNAYLIMVEQLSKNFSYAF